MFSVIIIGGENTKDYEFFQRQCAKFLSLKAKSGEHIRILTVGDEYVTTFANRFGIETKTFTCDWLRDGKSASLLRNKSISSEADAIIYFDANNKDLDILYDYATKRGLQYRRVKINN